MAKGKEKQRKAQAHEKENEAPTPATAPNPRPSKFKEATMNSTTSIHAPPDELWRDLGIDQLIERFNEEANAPAASASASVAHARTHKKSASTSTQATSAVPGPAVPATPAVAPASEGPLGRFSRAVASFWNNAGASFSALGKRKAGNENAEQKGIHKAGEDRKREVAAAYQQAKELGLLPTPKVFVRPVSRARKPVGSIATNPLPDTPTPISNTLAPPKTPTLYKSPSKKDLHKQKKLSKRVSDLEYRLAEARKELSLALSGENVPAVPPIPSNLPSPPNSLQHSWSENELSPHNHAELPPNPASSSKVGKIVKKRKAVSDNDEEFKPIPTDSDISLDSGRESKRSKTTPTKKPKRKKSSRLVKKNSNVATKEEVVVVVPDGVSVPPIPSIPRGVDGKRVAVGDDGYGGLEHEMF